jgi:aspartate ammonia-lyase
MSTTTFRTENDALGSRQIPADSLWGIHTLRAMENFPLAKRPIHPALIRAFGAVKLACARVNRSLGFLTDSRHAAAIEQACAEMMAGSLDSHITVDALQGGAGTSTNMNVNEVCANRALQIANFAPGRYDIISPLDHVNLHQSTNDTYPTALRVACIKRLRELEKSVIVLQEAFQSKEREFAHIVKVGRTEMQDAALITLGREAGAWAEAVGRDRWRIYKCEERLRVVNLGGTAVGTGLGAPREYIFMAADELRAITGIGLARAENLVEATQNADVFVEVSGILKACAASLLKITNDIRLLSSGPDAGFGEVYLPPRQAGSSIMPGKVNPVIPEAVGQAAMLVFGHDMTIAMAASAGSLELNHCLPLISHCLLESIDLLSSACTLLAEKCVTGMTANEAQCRTTVMNATATVTALVSIVGYENAGIIAKQAHDQAVSIRDAAITSTLINAAQFDAAIAPEAICRLGSPGAPDATRA